MEKLDIILLILLVGGPVLLYLLLLARIILDTCRREGKWGINFRRVVCPRCQARQPLIRFPASWRQYWWGGRTCKKCGCEMDKWGVEVVEPNSGAAKMSASLKVFIMVLLIALATSLGLLAHAAWLDIWWKMEVYGLAGYEGSTRALHDFRHGRLRLFVIAGQRDEDTFSGTNEGPFQIWFPQYYARPYPMKYSMDQEVKFYNEKMRYMHKHPEAFLSATNSRSRTLKSNAP